MNTYIGYDDIKNRYPFSGIFSDVDINFHADDVSTVTSLTLDSIKDSRRSTEKLPTQINQLLVDIQSMDDGELARAYRTAKELKQSVEDIVFQERMPRFTTAFNRMFESLKYSRIENVGGKKLILFRKNGIDIPINNLSSGEKQVVYRGCFLLKDVNATNGAFVFIDEPEISLHPNWQVKVMDYYKGIFTNCGEQTSQIFAVTHSPFVIHNDTRRNDKVIIFSRDDNGDIVVKDKPEYFKCNSIEAVQDAFQIDLPVDEQPVVYLEGRTDEKYFKKALEVYGYDVDFKFKWIGYIDEKGQEANTGKDALNKAVSFLIVLYSLMEQKLAEKRCVYNFTVVENSLSLEKYRRYSTERKSTFAYVCERENDNIDRPYYGMEVELEEDALGSVGIPLCMKVSTKLNGKSIDFLDVRIYAVRQGKVETSERLGKGIKIEKPIEDGKEFLIRILLECNNQMQNILSESRIYLSFKLTLTDDREKKYNKYIFLTVQNNAMGESNILSISSKNSWISYIGKMIKQHYRLTK